MLDESLVVQTAVSAFNNAALALPAFFWLGLLMLPLFYVVYLYGNRFLDIIGWERFGIQARVIKWTAIMSLIWLVLFGGNYVVLRDSETVLPFMTACLAALGMIYVGYVTRDIPLPVWHQMTRVQRVKFVLFCALMLSIIGLTDVHTWWGPGLQIVAFIGGGFVGRYMKYRLRDVSFIFVFLFLFTVMILMQPEFFRFGQLGNLTMLHLAGLLFVGAPIVGGVMLQNVKPRGKIYKSAYIKLKWLLRCLVILAICLFVMTESVPVFIGVCVLLGCLFWLNIIHARQMPEYLGDKLLMVSIFAFGILTIMPVVSCLAILGFRVLPRGNFVQDLKMLL